MAQGTNGADSPRSGIWTILDTLLVKRGGNKLRCEHGKVSVDFPNEAARCQRFLSERAQSNFEPRGRNGPAATRSPKSFPLPLADPCVPSVVSKRNESALTHKCINVRAKRRRFRRPAVIVDHDPAAIVEQVTVAIIDGVQKNVRAIGRAHHSVRAESSVPVPCAHRLPGLSDAKYAEVRAAEAGQIRSCRAVAQLGRAPGSGQVRDNSDCYFLFCRLRSLLGTSPLFSCRN